MAHTWWHPITSGIGNAVSGFFSGLGKNIGNNAGNIALGGAGLLALKEAYDRLGDIGDESQAGANIIAQQGLQQSQFQPFTVRSTTGSTFGFTPAVMPSYATPYAPPTMFPATDGGGGGGGYTPPGGGGFTPSEGIEPDRLISKSLLTSDVFPPSSGDKATPGPVKGSLASLTLAPREDVIQDMLQTQATSALLGIPYGELQRQQAAQRAFGLGGQFMGAAQMQPADINLLRGMFTQQAAGALGQPASIPQLPIPRPVGDVFPQQAMQPGSTLDRFREPAVSVQQAPMSPEMLMVTSPTGQQMPVSRQDPRLRGLSDDQIRAKLADPRAYQQAPTIGQFGQQALGLGMAGLDAQAPADVEALRQQYTQLASQTAGRALQDTAGREADVFERIRATQRPEEERQRLALEERMAQQGRLGVRTAMYGGTPEHFALAQAQEEAQNRASLAAIQQAQAERQQAVSEAQTFGGLFGQQAGLSSQLQSAAQQRAAQLSQLGLSAQQIESQLQSEGLGRAATSAQQAAQLAQVAGGLQAQQAGLGLQYAGLGSQLSLQDIAAQQAQQQLALGALTGSYIPQAQLMNVAQLGMTPIEMAQRGQLYGAGLFGEGSMTGLQSRLAAALGQANLFGTVGTGLLSGALGVKV